MFFPTLATDGGCAMELLGERLGRSVKLSTIGIRLAHLLRERGVQDPTVNDDDQPCTIDAKPQLPLEHIPEDVCLNLFSFFTARDLCSVRASSWQLLESTDLHAEILWKALRCRDFPLVREKQGGRPSHQEYIKAVLDRAVGEAGNLRVTQPARESLHAYALKHGGILGLVCDLGFIPDARIARAVSHKRRAAMYSAVVTNEGVVYDFRWRGLYSGPLNFLPLSTVLSQGTTLRADVDSILPLSREVPAPPGFLGYAVRLIKLKPEYEALRWTVLFAVFKDLAVFETSEQAEAVRVRMPHQHLLYCALDHPGALDDPCPPGEHPLPHIGHWNFRPLFADSRMANGNGDEPEMVGIVAERLEQLARNARHSLAYLQYGGMEHRPRSCYGRR